MEVPASSGNNNIPGRSGNSSNTSNASNTSKSSISANPNLSKQGSDFISKSSSSPLTSSVRSSLGQLKLSSDAFAAIMKGLNVAKADPALVGGLKVPKFSTVLQQHSTADLAGLEKILLSTMDKTIRADPRLSNLNQAIELLQAKGLSLNNAKALSQLSQLVNDPALFSVLGDMIAKASVSSQSSSSAGSMGEFFAQILSLRKLLGGDSGMSELQQQLDKLISEFKNQQTVPPVDVNVAGSSSSSANSAAVGSISQILSSIFHSKDQQQLSGLLQNLDASQAQAIKALLQTLNQSRLSAELPVTIQANVKQALNLLANVEPMAQQGMLISADHSSTKAMIASFQGLNADQQRQVLLLLPPSVLASLQQSGSQLGTQLSQMLEQVVSTLPATSDVTFPMSETSLKLFSQLLDQNQTLGQGQGQSAHHWQSALMLFFELRSALSEGKIDSQLLAQLDSRLTSLLASLEPLTASMQSLQANELSALVGTVLNANATPMIDNALAGLQVNSAAKLLFQLLSQESTLLSQNQSLNDVKEALRFLGKLQEHSMMFKTQWLSNLSGGDLEFLLFYNELIHRGILSVDSEGEGKKRRFNSENLRFHFDFEHLGPMLINVNYREPNLALTFRYQREASEASLKENIQILKDRFQALEVNAVINFLHVPDLSLPTLTIDEVDFQA